MTKLIMTLWPVAIILALLLAASCDDDGAEPSPSPTPTPTVMAPTSSPTPSPTTATPTASPTPSPTATAPTATPSPTPEATEPPSPSPTPSPEPMEPRVEVFLDNAEFPVSLAFAPDGRLFFNELRTGRVRIVQDGQLQEEPFAELDVVQLTTYSEHGLLGLALDPDFASNHYVYVFYSQPDNEGQPRRQRLVRFTEVDGIGQDMQVILDDLRIGPNCCHNGGRIEFGPDGKLYVSIGDTEASELSQDLESLAGKILRINPDGSTPDDNPFPGSPVFALGLRNPFGLAFHPVTGELFASENGPTSSDEVNVIRPGANYGWPEVTGVVGDPRSVDPIWVSEATAVAPTGLEFYTGDQLPGFQNDLFLCQWNSHSLSRLQLTEPGLDQLESKEETGEDCTLDVITGPDGALYFSTAETIFRWGS